MTRRQLVSSDEATPCVKRLTKPCSDCPWARTALPGWLGSLSIDAWLAAVRSEARIYCHVHRGPACAGAATFRANTGKLLRDSGQLRLPKDTERVFANAHEFAEHHKKGRP